MQHVSLSSFSIQRKSRGTILQFVFLTAGLTFILLICSLTFFPVAHAAGNFSYSLSGSARPGESIELSLIMPDDAPPVSGFRCGVSLEGSALTCSRIKGSGAVTGNSLYTSQATSDPVCVYAAAGGAASKLSGKLVTFTLLIPENAKGGDVYTVGLWADQICGENGKAVEGFSSYSQSLVIPVADTNGDRLASLKPDTGELSPAFSPDIFSYSLRVPSSVKEVHFEAKAQNGAEIKISRFRLQAAGKSTEIRITLTSEDGGKTVYVVTVYRENGKTGGSSQTGKGQMNGNSSKDGSNFIDSMDEYGSNNSGILQEDFSHTSQSPLQILQNNLPEWMGLLSLFFSASALILALIFILKKKKEPTNSSEAESTKSNKTSTENRASEMQEKTEPETSGKTDEDETGKKDHNEP